MIYQYNAFGLNIHSSIEIPEFISHDGKPDIQIELGKVPDQLEDPKQVGVRFQAKPGLFWMKKDLTAKYLAADGKRVVVDRFPEARDRDVRLYLLGSVIGAILHQRGMLPLHASAVRVKDQCVLFCGRGGTGKSTTAKALMMKGYELHSDDICVIKMTGKESHPLVFPGYPQMKLWEDALDQLGVEWGDFPQVRQVWNKFAVPVRDAFSGIPLPVKKIYILSPHNQEQIKGVPLKGINKFNALKNQTYRYYFLKGLGKVTQHFQLASKVAKQVPVVQLFRPQKPFMLDQLISFIEADIMA